MDSEASSDSVANPSPAPVTPDFVKKGWAVKGRFDLFLAILPLDRARISCMLPDPAMHLAPPGEVPPSLRNSANDLHPLVLMVGKQHEIELTYQGKSQNAGIFDYLEAASLVPYVRLGTRRKNYSHVCLLYLNRTLPYLLGRFLGLNKRIATIDQYPDRGPVLAQSVSRQASLIFEFNTQGNAPKPGVGVGRFGAFPEIEKIFGFPTVGKKDDLFLCSEPEFDFSATTASPVPLACQNWGDLCPAAPRDFEIDPMPADIPLGSLWVEKLNWVYPLGYPNDCTP